MSAVSLATNPFAVAGQPMADFRTYLENSLRNPFTLDLKDYPLLDIVRICANAKSKQHPRYRETISSLVFNLENLEREYRVRLYPVQVTDIFWGYFVAFCQGRGLRNSSIMTICSQLKSILNWAVKYNAPVSPTYLDCLVPSTRNVEIALTADEVSRISYFDIDRFYAGRRKDYRLTMERVRDMFVIGCSLGQRHSDLVRIEPSCFERNVFRITQQKTGNLAVVNLDLLAIEPKTVYRLLEKYGHRAPYPATIGNYNHHLHTLARDVGLTDPVRFEERVNGELVVKNIPKWKMISSHTARRTFTTVNILRGRNVSKVKRATGHTDLKSFDKYIRDDE